MNRNTLWQMGAFVVILLVLNALFAIHISIIGSVLLTVGLTLAFNAFNRR